MVAFEFAAAALGAFLAIASILVDLCGNATPNTLGRSLDQLATPLAFRKDVPARDNLRQALAVCGSIVLLLFAVWTTSVVYAALESVMLFSKVLWFVPLGTDSDLSDRRKTTLRVVIAAVTWIFLEVTNSCGGFHRIGVLGLELLGCAYAVQRPLMRSRLLVSGSAAIVLYASMGVIWDSDRLVIHSTQLMLNGIFLGLSLAHWRQSRGAR